MLKVQEIKELIRTIDQTTIDEFTYEQDGMKITLKKNNKEIVQVTTAQETVATAPQPSIPATAPKVEEVEKQVEATPAVKEEKKEEVEVSENIHMITSPMVGTFYVAPSPDSPPYVNKGDEVKEDTVVCIVEAMKLMNEIEAEVNGKIVDVLAENGQLVEYGQPLFAVEVNE